MKRYVAFSFFLSLFFVMPPIASADSPLLNAIKAKDLHRVVAIIRSNPKALNDSLSCAELGGGVAIHLAAHIGYLPVIKYLIQKGANVNDRGTCLGWTPMHCAASRGYIDVMKLLISHGAKINARAGLKLNYMTPLDAAFFCSNNGRLSADIRNRCALAADWIRNNKGLRGDIFYAVKKCDTTLIKSILLSFPNSANLSSFHSFYPIHYAAMNCGLGIIKMLISSCSRCNPKNDFGQTPLAISEKNNKSDIAAYLRKRASQLEELKKQWIGSGEPDAVITSIEKQDFATLQRILKKYGSIATNARKTNNGDTPLHLACRLGRMKMVELLLKNCADPEARNWDRGSTPLILAALHGYTNIMKRLIKYGAMVDSPQLKSGATPLDFAVYYGRMKAAQLLIKNGANVNAKDKTGAVPLHYVKNVEIANLLLSSGANIDARKNNGLTALHVASRYGRLKIVEWLINHRVSVNCRSAVGWTPLHLASWYNHPEVMKYLLSRGAEINAKNNRGITPLHMAAYAGNTVAAELLLKNGANIKAKDQRGLSPVDFARKKGHRKLANRLLSLAASSPQARVRTTSVKSNPELVFLTIPIEVSVGHDVYKFGYAETINPQPGSNYPQNKILIAVDSRGYPVRDKDILKKIFLIDFIYRPTWNEQNKLPRGPGDLYGYKKLEQRRSLLQITQTVLLIREAATRLLVEALKTAITGGSSVASTLARATAISMVKAAFTNLPGYLQAVVSSTFEEAVAKWKAANRLFYKTRGNPILRYENAYKIMENLEFAQTFGQTSLNFVVQLTLKQGGGADLWSQIRKIGEYALDEALNIIVNKNLKASAILTTAVLGKSMHEFLLQKVPEYAAYLKNCRRLGESLHYDRSVYWTQVSNAQINKIIKLPPGTVIYNNSPHGVIMAFFSAARKGDRTRAEKFCTGEFLGSLRNSDLKHQKNLMLMGKSFRKILNVDVSGTRGKATLIIDPMQGKTDFEKRKIIAKITFITNLMIMRSNDPARKTALRERLNRFIRGEVRVKMWLVKSNGRWLIVKTH